MPDAYGNDPIMGYCIQCISLSDDPYELNDLAVNANKENTVRIQEMKQRILDILAEDYVPPHSLRIANWGAELGKELPTLVDGKFLLAYNTGWCNNVTLTMP